MLFNSYVFVLAFLPICIIGYFIANKFNTKLGQSLLIGMSLWFYGYFNVSYLFIIIGSIIVNYFIYRLIIKHMEYSRYLMVIGVCLNISVLIYFKYTNFFIELINDIFKSEFRILSIVLPLGISFFTFQQISFIIDASGGGDREGIFTFRLC